MDLLHSLVVTVQRRVEARRSPYQRASALLLGAFMLLAPTAVNSCGSSTKTPTPSTTTTTTTAAPTTSTTVLAQAPAASALSIRVSGRSFVDQNGQVVQLRGVNRSSTEYRCVQNIPYGFMTDDNGTAGQSDAYIAAFVAALKTWNAPGATAPAVNTVRIPLNEDCWLGINGANPTYAGAAYQTFIRDEVSALAQAGVYSILDLHWSAAGSTLATSQDVGPDADHAVTFWSQVASTFKSSPSVLFDLFNEPHLWCYTTTCNSDYGTAAKTAWGCYRDGCTYAYNAQDSVSGRTTGTVQIAGTQQLVDAIRAAGANNPILIAGLGYANAFDNWVAFLPKDPAGQLAADLHSYPNSGANVNNTSYLDSTMASSSLSSKYPIVVGEFGEFLCGSSTTGFTESTMAWADSHGYSYTAWGWDKGEGCNGPSLVTSNAGTPSTYGAIVEAHLRSREG